MKPATENIWKIRRKLEELAARGIEGERETAQRKLERLLARFDFAAGEPDGPSIFDGAWKPSRCGAAVLLASFGPTESVLGGFVKWAIENGAGIRGLWRMAGTDVELWVEAEPESLPQLRRLSETVQTAFGELWRTAAPIARPGDRAPFFLGLYDGMMSDDWPAGKPLPAAYVAPVKRPRKGKRTAVTVAPGMALHAYSVALELGRKIRFSVPIGEIAKELSQRINLIAA